MKRRGFLQVMGIAAATFIGSAGGVIMADDTYKLTVSQTYLPVKGLHPALEGFTIVQLSDLHLLPYTRSHLIQSAVGMANDLQPDLTVLTGDYVWKVKDAAYEIASILGDLNARYGVYSVLGNHDYWLDLKAIQSAFKDAHVPILYNQGLEIGVGNGSLFLAGVDDGWAGQPDLKMAMENAPSGVPAVVLLHEPDLADFVCTDPRVILQLSGHTHGGQVLLRGNQPLVHPYLGKKYHSGLFRIRDMHLYVTRGIGVIAVPIRLECPPEITHITLMAG